MADNPFFQMDQPQNQSSAPQAAPPAPKQAPVAAPVDQNNPFFQMKDPGTPPPAPPPSNEPEDTGYFAPERKVWGMMQADPLGTAGKIGSAALNGLYGGFTNAVNSIKPTVQAMGQQTASNTATPEVAGRVANAAMMMTPGDMMAPGLSGKAVRAGVKTPSESELFKTGGADLDAARDSGVDYSIPHAVNLSNTAEQAIYNQGIGPADAPRTFAKLAEARNVPAGAVSMPINGLMGARRGFSSLTADKQASDMDRAAASIALGHYQNFLENPPPQSVLAGPASAASDLINRGNANYAAGMRSNLVTNKEESADLKAGSANSGRNYDNTIRQKFRPLVDPDDPRHNIINSWTPDEQQALAGVVRGTETPTQNTLRTIGNLGAGGHGVGASVLGIGSGLLGEHMFGPVGTMAGFIPPVAGSVARTMQNTNARKAVEGLGEQLRQRSPLYQERAANAPYTVNPDIAAIGAARAIPLAVQQQPQPDQTGWGMGYNPQYAKGGKVKKPTHEFLVNRLMKLAEKAKREEKKATAPILNMPDDAVTTALAKAQEAI